MNITSNSAGYIDVAFGTPVEKQGVSDSANYILTSTNGGVPIRVTAIEPVIVEGEEDVVVGARLHLSPITNGKQYRLEVRGLQIVEIGAGAFHDVGLFNAVASFPQLSSAQQLQENEVVLTFSTSMRVGPELVSPAQYTITGPSTVLVKEVYVASDRQVVLDTVGLAQGSYLVTVSGAVRDVAGNGLSSSRSFGGHVARGARSIFTDKGPIAKPALTLLTGTATITGPTRVLILGTGSILAIHVGLYLSLTGAGASDGVYRITSRHLTQVFVEGALVSATEVRVAASFEVLEDPVEVQWALMDYRDGQIADDPNDVVVRVNGQTVVTSGIEAVIGLLGQVVLWNAPGPDDVVEIDYAWIRNPHVDVRRLNSREFQLNNWNRDINRPTDAYGHKYRFNNVLAQPESFVALDLRAEMDQPLVRDLKYRAYERAYSVALNDASLLVLNAPHHKIAYPPLTRLISSTFVNFQSETLPESDPVDPWVWSGAGSAAVSGSMLTVVDDEVGANFWSRHLDLTFDHVLAHAWRVQVIATSVTQGVFTGVASGYSDGERVCVVGYLSESGSRKLGILRRGFGNDPSSAAAWMGGEAGLAVDLDWSVVRSYRIFRDSTGIGVYVDGAVVPLLQATTEDLPFLSEINAPFNALQGPFFGSLSKEAASESSWDFVRYTVIPTNPFESEPSVFVEYLADGPPDAAPHPWTPIGFHGTETYTAGHLLLDSTSANDQGAEALIGGDFRGYTRIEPLLAEAFDTTLDVKLAVRTHTHGITPNAVMAAIDDGDRLMQLCFLSDEGAPAISYGGRTLPPDFGSYQWSKVGAQETSMVGQHLRISTLTPGQGSVAYIAEDFSELSDATRVFAPSHDYMFEFRVKVLSHTPDLSLLGFCGVNAMVRDGFASVGVQLLDLGAVALHSEGNLPGSSAYFFFDWDDGQFHTYRCTKSGALLTLSIDGVVQGSVVYSDFQIIGISPVGVASFGSGIDQNGTALSDVVWDYANFWRVVDGRRYVGLWKGYDGDSLTGYHLPLRASGRSADVDGNRLADPSADFSALEVGDQLVVDAGPNKGTYTVASVIDATSLTIVGQFPMQPSEVDYRCPLETDWEIEHRYRVVKNPNGVEVLLDDETTPLIRLGYSATSLPPSATGLPHAVAAGLPSITWGAFEPTTLSQTAWDFVRFGAVRSLSGVGIAPHHQVLNQRNTIASYEYLRTNIPHERTDFWSESEGIPPNTEPDLLQDPNLVAYTLLNDRTPLVPSTQAFRDNGFTLPDDLLYNSLQVIERTTGEPDLLAPFDDELALDHLSFQNEVCLGYDGSVLPEDDLGASSPWSRVSDDDAHQSSSVAGGILTYSTDGTGTRTVYRNATMLADSVSLPLDVKFRVRVLQDASNGLGDSGARVGFSSPGVTVGLAFVTTPLGERYVLAVDLNNGQTVGGIPFNFYDGAFHTYVLRRDPASASIQIRVEG